jgi:hypothetical protein
MSGSLLDTFTRSILLIYQELLYAVAAEKSTNKEEEERKFKRAFQAYSKVTGDRPAE